MADNSSFLCLLGAIDRLWFHQTILFSGPMSVFGPNSSKINQDQTPQQSISDTFTYPSPSLSFSPLADDEMDFSPRLYEENSSDSPQTATTPQDDSNNEEEDDVTNNEEEDDVNSISTEITTLQKNKTRPTRLNILANRLTLIRSHSSSLPTDENRPRKKRACSSASSTPSGTRTTAIAAAMAARKLQKSMSCRSLEELELEEVKGFMDLGFTFKKEHLSPRMMSLVPGLQRLEMQGEKDDDEDGGRVGVMRPYLSEAWLIKRPDSPLLNLRLPRVSAAADMKKHLKFWARTVASEIHQES